MTNVTNELYVNGLGQIVYCNDSSFDKASSAVLKSSDGLISFRDLAYARIVNANNSGSWKNGSVNTNGSYVQEGPLYVPNSKDKRIMLRNSLVLQNSALAVKAHVKSNEYILKNFKVEEYLEGLKKNVDYLVVKNLYIPTKEFDKYDETIFAFGDQAKDYGLLLDKVGIESLNIWMHNGNDAHIDSQSGPFANQFWLHEFGYNSNVYGSSRSLDNNSRVRGVRRELSVEGGAPKNLQNVQVPSAPSETTYTMQQAYTLIKNEMAKQGLSINGDLEKRILSGL